MLRLVICGDEQQLWGFSFVNGMQSNDLTKLLLSIVELPFVDLNNHFPYDDSNSRETKSHNFPSYNLCYNTCSCLQQFLRIVWNNLVLLLVHRNVWSAAQ